MLRAATAINMDKSGTDEGKAAEDAVFCKQRRGCRVAKSELPADWPPRHVLRPSRIDGEDWFPTNGQWPVSGLAKANGNRGVRRLETRAARGPFRQRVV